MTTDPPWWRDHLWSRTRKPSLKLGQVPSQKKLCLREEKDVSSSSSHDSWMRLLHPKNNIQYYHLDGCSKKWSCPCVTRPQLLSLQCHVSHCHNVHCHTVHCHPVHCPLSHRPIPCVQCHCQLGAQPQRAVPSPGLPCDGPPRGRPHHARAMLQAPPCHLAPLALRSGLHHIGCHHRQGHSVLVQTKPPSPPKDRSQERYLTPSARAGPRCRSPAIPRQQTLRQK